jgi:hypothetical protein
VVHLGSTAKTKESSLACCHGFAVAAGDEPIGQVETPVFSGTSLEPDALIVRTVEEIPGMFAAVAVAKVAEVDESEESITLRCTREELLGYAAPPAPTRG